MEGLDAGGDVVTVRILFTFIVPATFKSPPNVPDVFANALLALLNAAQAALLAVVILVFCVV